MFSLIQFLLLVLVNDESVMTFDVSRQMMSTVVAKGVGRIFSKGGRPAICFFFSNSSDAGA